MSKLERQARKGWTGKPLLTMQGEPKTGCKSTYIDPDMPHFYVAFTGRMKLRNRLRLLPWTLRTWRRRRRIEAQMRKNGAGYARSAD